MPVDLTLLGVGTMNSPAACDTAEDARLAGVRGVVFARVGRPSIRALDAGERPPYGEWGVDGRTYRP